MKKLNNVLQKSLPALMLFCIVNLQGQAILDWAIHLGGDAYAYDYSFDVITDDENNIYITGYFLDTVDFDPGPGESIYYYDDYSKAMYLAKFSASGELIWVITAGDSYYAAQGAALQFDNDGNILLTGWIFGEVDLDPGVGEAMTGNTVSGSALAMFAAKYSADGDYLTSFATGGYYNTEGKQIFADADNNIIVIGTYKDEVDFDPSGAEATLTAENFYGELFFATYSPTGNFISVKGITAEPSANNFDFGNFVAKDADDNFYVTGMFNETCDFDPGASVTEITTETKDIFFAKYDVEFNLQWVKQIKTTDDEGYGETHAIAIDDAGNIYLAGWYRREIDADPSSGEFILENTHDEVDDMFFAKYSPAGEFIWAKTIGGEGYDYARNILVDEDGLVYVSGDFYHAVDFDPGAGTAVLQDADDTETMFIALYDNNGNYLNASAIESETFGTGLLYNMHFDNAGDILITGVISGVNDFDCTEDEFLLTSNGDYDLFLAKYDSIIALPVAVHEIEMDPAFIFPNPASEIISVQLPGNMQHAEIVLYDASMRRLQEFSTDEKQITLPVKQYAEGLYFLSVSDGEQTSYSKFIIE